MSERKVSNKYYPPDYDPSKIPRIKRKNKQSDVRIMAPFNMRCSTCGEYIANATKFNAKKETIEDQTYNNLMIFRFYIRCPRCLGTIIFRTDPKEQGYEVESGATENFRALKLAEREAREEAEAEEEEEKINPMKHLENRTKASKQQMEASEQIQNLRSIKHRFHSVNIDSLIEEKRKQTTEDPEINPDTDLRDEARLILKRKSPEPYVSTVPSIRSTTTKCLGTSSKLSSSISSLKKKVKITPKEASKVSNSLS